MAALSQCGTLYVLEGGVFVWPGVRKGYTVPLSTGDPTLSDVMLTTVSLFLSLSLAPSVVLLPPSLPLHTVSLADCCAHCSCVCARMCVRACVCVCVCVCVYVHRSA